MKKVRDPIRAGVIGLGIMGGAFARHLAAAGVRTSGYDLLSANLDAFSAQRRSCLFVGARGGRGRPIS